MPIILYLIPLNLLGVSCDIITYPRKMAFIQNLCKKKLFKINKIAMIGQI